MKNICTRHLILELLEDEGPLHVYAIYRKLRDGGHQVRYGTIRWQILFLKNDGLIRPLPPWEAQDLGLQVAPNRSVKSGIRPPLNRRYYELA